MTDRPNAAHEMIGQYLFLGGRLREAKVQKNFMGLLRQVTLTLKAYRSMPGITYEHLKFAAKASNAIQHIQAVPRATLSAQDAAILLNQLRQLQENSISAIDPACVTFCHLRENVLTEMAQQTLISGAQSAGLLSHADALPVVCCIPTSSPHLLEIVIRDRRNFDYKVLVLDFTASDIFATRDDSPIVHQITNLMPVVEG